MEYETEVPEPSFELAVKGERVQQTGAGSWDWVW